MSYCTSRPVSQSFVFFQSPTDEAGTKVTERIRRNSYYKNQIISFEIPPFAGRPLSPNMRPVYGFIVNTLAFGNYMSKWIINISECKGDINATPPGQPSEKFRFEANNFPENDINLRFEYSVGLLSNSLTRSTYGVVDPRKKLYINLLVLDGVDGDGNPTDGPYGLFVSLISQNGPEGKCQPGYNCPGDGGSPPSPSPPPPPPPPLGPPASRPPKPQTCCVSVPVSRYYDIIKQTFEQNPDVFPQFTNNLSLTNVPVNEKMSIRVPKKNEIQPYIGNDWKLTGVELVWTFPDPGTPPPPPSPPIQTPPSGPIESGGATGAGGGGGISPETGSTESVIKSLSGRFTPVAEILKIPVLPVPPEVEPYLFHGQFLPDTWGSSVQDTYNRELTLGISPIWAAYWNALPDPTKAYATPPATSASDPAWVYKAEQWAQQWLISNGNNPWL